jgi:hypothetical protein
MKEDDIKREIDRMIDYRKPNYPHDDGPLTDDQLYQIRKLTMNDKIKQYAELSKTYKTILVDGQMQSVLLIDPEKFAGMLIDAVCDDMMSLEPMYPANIVALKIKQKYGVPI